MTEVELTVPDGDIVGLFEAAALDLGLAVQRGTLGKYPGCTHWHLTTPGQKGTLEATWWPARNRLWLCTHANRRAAWQDSAIGSLVDAIGPFTDDAAQNAAGTLAPRPS